MADVRTIVFWLIGTVCLFFGALIAGSVAPVTGSTTISIMMAYALAFILILLGGMFWISTAILQTEEE